MHLKETQRKTEDRAWFSHLSRHTARKRINLQQPTWTRSRRPHGAALENSLRTMCCTLYKITLFNKISSISLLTQDTYRLWFCLQLPLYPVSELRYIRQLLVWKMAGWPSLIIGSMVNECPGFITPTPLFSVHRQQSTASQPAHGETVSLYLNTLKILNWRAPWKNRIYWYISFFRPSLNHVLFPMFCLLVERECQILVF